MLIDKSTTLAIQSLGKQCENAWRLQGALQSCVVVFGSGAKFKTKNKRTNFPILREMWNQIQCSVKAIKGRKTKVRRRKKGNK